MPVTGPPAELSRGLVSTRWNARAAAARALTALVRAEHGCDGRVQQASASPAAPATASAWAVRAGAERATARSQSLSLIHISEPTRRTPISYAVFCLKKKKRQKTTKKTLN